MTKRHGNVPYHVRDHCLDCHNVSTHSITKDNDHQFDCVYRFRCQRCGRVSWKFCRKSPTTPGAVAFVPAPRPKTGDKGPSLLEQAEHAVEQYNGC